MTDEEFWLEYLVKNNLNQENENYKIINFDSEKNNEEIMNLILSKEKTARLSALGFFKDKKNIPKEGDKYIFSLDEKTKCIIETTKIRILIFKNVTFELAKLEGEEKNLASWQKNHIEYFKKHSKENDYNFNYDMPVVFEEFEVIYKRA